MRAAIAALLAVLLALVSEPAGWGSLLAQESPLSKWELLPLQAGPGRDSNVATALFGPPSGPLFATLRDGTFRSDDGGNTWTMLPLSRVARLRAVDPVDASVLYIQGPAGLYKSRDGGATLEPILLTGAIIARVAISPVQPSLVYVSIDIQSVGDGGRSQLLRSRDGGQSWEIIDEVRADPPWSTNSDLLYPHPVLVDRLFYQSGQTAPREPVGPLRHSADQGGTWAKVFAPTGTLVGMVGGSGLRPERLYAVDRFIDRPTLAGEATSGITRSDDDGATWTETHRFRRAFISAVAFDPAQPDRVWVGLYSPGRGVWESTDGGQTWTDLDSQPLGDVYALLAGIDGRNLYAGTEQGVWRLRIERRTFDETGRAGRGG